MATSTLVQFLAEGSGTDTSARRQVQTFIAAEAIAANDAVSLDLAQAIDGDKSLKVMKADTGTATDKCFVGIALEGAAAGARIDVCIAGICEANVAGTTAAGSVLQIGSTAGQLDVRTTAVNEGGAATFNLFPVCGIAAHADVGNVATIFVFKQF